VRDPVRSAPSKWSPLRWLGVGSAGAGAVALGVGGYFGWSAFDAKDRSGCGAGGACQDQAGVESWAQARDDAGMATVFTLSGVALVGVGVVLYVVGGNDKQASGPGVTLMAGPGALGPSSLGAVTRGVF
jgi:hypothetical protein